MKKFLILFALIIFFAGCGNDENQFKTEKVFAAGENLTLTRDGKISLSRSLSVYANTSGAVVEKFFKDGDAVTAGQEIFKIGSAAAQTDLLKAKADLGAAMTSLARETARKNPVDEIQAEISELQERVKILEDEAAGETIRAQVAGQIVANVHTGQDVKANETVLAKIGSSDPVVVRFEISADEKNFLSTGAPKISLKLPDGTTYPRAGTITFPNDKTAEVAFSNDGTLTLGETVQLELGNANLPNAVLVPESAIQKRDGENVVFVVDENKNVVMKKISLVGKKEKNFIVSDGLKAGDAVIIENASSIENLK